MAVGSCNSIAKNVHFSDVDCHYYIISGQSLTFFNINKTDLCCV